MGADGRLYASQPQQKRIVSYGPAGDEKVVAQNVVADDLAVTAKGGGLLRRQRAQDRGAG